MFFFSLSPIIYIIGYDFSGWFTTTSGGSKITESSTVSTDSNHNLYAHWTQKQYAIYDTSNNLVSYADSLSAAITAASTGYTIQALVNNSSAAVTIDKNLTLDTNGKTITMTGAITNNAQTTVKGTGTITISSTYGITNNGTLIWNDATIVGSGTMCTINNDEG